MTFDEANEICRELTNINISIWNTTSRTSKIHLKDCFASKVHQLHDAGFKLRKWKQDGKPMFAPRIDKHKDDVVFSSNKPDDLNIKNDCTTRCISFCTGEDYSKIRAEQLANAKATGKSYLTWRHDVVWQKSLLSRGFEKIVLDRRHVSRATFLKLAKNLSSLAKCIIATVSSHHIAAIDMASRKILDTWNSSGGRITCIFVPSAYKHVYYNWLVEAGCCI